MVLYKPKLIYGLVLSTNSVEEQQKNPAGNPSTIKIIVSIIPALAVPAITQFSV